MWNLAFEGCIHVYDNKLGSNDTLATDDWAHGSRAMGTGLATKQSSAGPAVLKEAPWA